MTARNVLLAAPPTAEPLLNTALHARIARDGLARPSTLASALAALDSIRREGTVASTDSARHCP